MVAPPISPLVVLFTIAWHVTSCFALSVVADGVSRRAFLCGGAVTIGSWGRRPRSSLAVEEKSTKALLALLPQMPNGSPATNATISKELVTKIEAEAFALETATNQRGNARSPKLIGNWRLLYTNAPEITSLASGLPIGFALGPTYQPISIDNAFENRASVSNQFAKIQSIVVGSVREAQPNTLNAIGVNNLNGNRVDVDFSCIAFELDEIFGRTVAIRKSIIPKVSTGAAQPANDQTYLDDTVRVIRGGDGSLFIFVRDDKKDPRMFNTVERERLCNSSKAQQSAVGIGAAEQSESPEIKYLFQGRRK